MVAAVKVLQLKGDPWGTVDVAGHGEGWAIEMGVDSV